jgi:hypothetical protein
VEHIKADRVAKELKQLIFRENMRRSYRKLGKLIRPNPRTGLSKIDVPDSAATTPEYGDPTKPNTWKGPWKTITDPLGIVEVVREMNKRQYQQSYETPFGSGPLADAIGRTGNTSISASLLNGTLPDTTSMHLLPETNKILYTLSRPCAVMPDGKNVISADEFSASFKASNEATSSSPSGRHVGHYKAAIGDPSLETLHSAMVSLPFQMCFSPTCWERVTDIMLKKNPGDSRCHRLHIIALFK